MQEGVLVMDESLKTILVVLGVLSILYVLFRYILPIIFKIIGYILGGILYLAVGILIIMAIIWLFSFLMNKVKNG